MVKYSIFKDTKGYKMFLQKPNNSLSNYSLKTPVKSNGTLTNYGKMLMLAYRMPKGTKFTKINFLNEAGHSFNKSCPAGYCSGTFAILNQNNLISYSTKTKKLQAGTNLKEYVETYILPFI